MTGTAPQIEWYIARDGARHGPISDVEMRKVVELGHLRPTDLVWCPRFPEWLPAAQAFPRELGSRETTQPPTVAAQVTPNQAAPATAASPVPSAAVVPNPATHVPTHVPVTATQISPEIRPTQTQPLQNQPSQSLNEDAAWAQAMRGVLQQPEPAPRPMAPLASAPMAAANQTANQAGNYPDQQLRYDSQPRAQAPYAPSPYEPTQLGSGQLEARPHADETTDYTGDHEKPRRRDWIGVTAAAAAVILVVCGLGWITWQNRSLVSGASAIGSAIKAKVSSAPSADAYRLSPYSAPGETRDLIDASLQRTAIWRILKRDHPEWYGERLVDVEQRRAQKQDEKAISRFLADVIVTLRRRHAQVALQSSPEHLRRMAKSFTDNLRQLESRDGSTCFAFITFGESNPITLDLSHTPAFGEALQRQMVAVFEAITDGRANRHIHAATRRADYDLLTKDLTARDWSQTDLAIFSDPARLSSSPPDKVCTLVQQWFQTHLALSDQELQTRLLAESLKPLVGG